MFDLNIHASTTYKVVYRYSRTDDMYKTINKNSI